MSKDRDLQSEVLAELGWEPSINAAHIGVTANDGVITLSGHVDTYAQKHAAEDSARSVKGVKAVAEDIEVRLAFDDNRSDDEIATAALERLSWDSSVPTDKIQLNVENGWVTLTGEVEWHFQKNAAMFDIRMLHGVVGVSNQITIKSNVNTKNISEDIRRALHRSWFDPSTIKVTADGGKVRLTGSVPSWQDRQTAATTAWAAPGAISVENDLYIA